MALCSCRRKTRGDTHHLQEWTLVSIIRVLLCSLGIISNCLVWPIEGTDAGLSMTVDDTDDDEMEFTSLSSNPMLRRKWLGSDHNTSSRAQCTQHSRTFMPSKHKFLEAEICPERCSFDPFLLESLANYL